MWGQFRVEGRWEWKPLYCGRPLSWPCPFLFPSLEVQSAHSHPISLLHCILLSSSLVVIWTHLAKAMGKEGKLRSIRSTCTVVILLHSSWPPQTLSHRTQPVFKRQQPRPNWGRQKKHNEKVLPQPSPYPWPFKLWAAICLWELSIFCLSRVSQIFHWSLCPTTSHCLLASPGLVPGSQWHCWFTILPDSRVCYFKKDKL